MRKYLLFLLFILIHCQQLFAQNIKLLDSLQRVYTTASHDTTKVLTLTAITNYYTSSSIDTSLVLANQALGLAEKIKFTRGIGQVAYSLGAIHLAKGNYPQALEYYLKSLSILEKNNDKKLLGSILNNIGLLYKYQGNYLLSLEYYQKGLKISEELQDEKAIATRMANIGSVYDNLSNTNLALEYYAKSLKISERLKDKRSIVGTLNNIGLMYQRQGKDSLALVTFFKVLKLQEDNGDRKITAIVIDNIGLVYSQQKNYPLAQEYLEKGLQMSTETKDILGMVRSASRLAQVYSAQKNYDKAIEYVEKVLHLAKERNLLLQVRTLNLTLYQAYRGKKDYQKALQYHEEYKQISDSLFNVDKSKSIANLESRVALEKKEKEFTLLAKDNEVNRLTAEKQAHELEIARKQVEAEQLLSLARAEKDQRKQDSLYNLAQQANLEAENLKTKEEKNKLEAEKQKLEHLAELQQQKRIRNTFLGLSITALLVIILVAIGYYQKQKSNRLLAQQNSEIKRQQAEIAEKNNELSQANEELFQQQEELKVLNENLEIQKQEIEQTYAQLKVTSEALNKSIDYAFSIQSIILADTAPLLNFFSEIFILYKPRDVVSGDFYWFSQISDIQAVFVLADCTGHGVPGAFMSMLGSTLLDEAVNERQLYSSPADILKFLHQRLHKMLKQAEGRNADGMDISIVYFEKTPTNTHIRFSGAKSNVYYVADSQLYSLDGDRTYLGGKKPTAAFTNREVSVAQHTLFYFFSDGFIDQNNEKREKFGLKRFQELLLNSHALPLQHQKDILEQTLLAHQGVSIQRDDISVIGLKIS